MRADPALVLTAPANGARPAPAGNGSPASEPRAPNWRETVRYLTYRGLAAGMGHMPEPLAHGVARTVAGVMARRGGPAMEMAELHIRRVLATEYPNGVEPDPALVRRLAKRSFDYYARYWADGARLPYETEYGVRLHWRLEEGDEHLRNAMAAGKGIVMALPHVGSWEWGGYWLALEGMPMTAVMEELEPPQLFEWFVGQRASMGITAVPLGEGSSAALIRALKKNQLAGLVSDRDLVGNGVEVEFFGERTTLPGGAATLALRTGAPLICVCVYSGPGANWHTAVVHAPLDTTRRGGLREDITRVTQDMARTFEHDIRCRPEQWHMYQPVWADDPQ
ncbi:MAG TPA: phosphatidylinositol mannoside acyltransferase [Acidimicrobiales bacterium]|nr:phosphatidylinositol mannoside acyltransferase [Acidimicrobiales bacterium]